MAMSKMLVATRRLVPGVPRAGGVSGGFEPRLGAAAREKRRRCTGAGASGRRASLASLRGRAVAGEEGGGQGQEARALGKITELEASLVAAIDAEDYARAAAIRDELKRITETAKVQVRPASSVPSLL